MAANTCLSGSPRHSAKPSNKNKFVSTFPKLENNILTYKTLYLKVKCYVHDEQGHLFNLSPLVVQENDFEINDDAGDIKFRVCSGATHTHIPLLKLAIRKITFLIKHQVWEMQSWAKTRLYRLAARSDRTRLLLRLVESFSKVFVSRMAS